MEKVVVGLLAFLLAGGAAVAHWGPVRAYGVDCEKRERLYCALERTKASGTQRWDFEVTPDAVAEVRVVDRRRGQDIYLYLRYASHDVFAAQYETANPVRDAQADAARLNLVFRSAGPARARFVVEPPAYYRWLTWGLLALAALMVLALARAMRRGT